ncbi:MAG: hypothetical protein ACLPVJ_15735, partial [Syntrophobacteraceae bacterium]
TGLLFAGVGVVPIAFVALIVHSEWSIFIQLVISLFLVSGFRSLGLYLGNKNHKSVPVDNSYMTEDE